MSKHLDKLLEQTSIIFQRIIWLL